MKTVILPFLISKTALKFLLKKRSQEEINFRQMSEVTSSRGLSSRVQPTITEITKQREVIKVSSIGDKSFSLVSYNILADCHMEPEWWANRGLKPIKAY